MEGYYENILPVAEATGRLQPPEQSSTSGKYLVFFYRGSHKKVLLLFWYFLFLQQTFQVILNAMPVLNILKDSC